MRNRRWFSSADEWVVRGFWIASRDHGAVKRSDELREERRDVQQFRDAFCLYGQMHANGEVVGLGTRVWVPRDGVETQHLSASEQTLRGCREQRERLRRSIAS